jgi:hypothetical protein
MGYDCKCSAGSRAGVCGCRNPRYECHAAHESTLSGATGHFAPVFVHKEPLEEHGLPGKGVKHADGEQRAFATNPRARSRAASKTSSDELQAAVCSHVRRFHDESVGTTFALARATPARQVSHCKRGSTAAQGHQRAEPSDSAQQAQRRGAPTRRRQGRVGRAAARTAHWAEVA